MASREPLDETVKSRGAGFAMDCKKGGAVGFEGCTRCGTLRKNGGFALLQGAQRQAGHFGRIVPLREDSELLRPERELRAEGFCCIAGVDEAGRGPLAGPVVAAAVVLPLLPELPGVFDSKQLSAARREELYGEIMALPGVQVGVGIVEAPEIDELNILRATHLAMRKALLALEKVDFALVDGLPVKGLPVPSRNMVKGDARCASIAAASIVAKVRRDAIMVEADARYPGYGFAEHKGYGCASHVEALKKLGVTPIHRRSFRPVREILEPPPRQMELF